MDDFIKKAYEMGKIKPVEEAFEEFPVEEENHKGNAYSYIFEDSVSYGSYNIGDIVFIKEFKYANGSKGKNHLFVIVGRFNIVVPIEYFVMLISSNIEKLKYGSNILLSKDNKNNLKKDSIVKTDVMYQIKEEQILFKIGSVEEVQLDKYKENFLLINNS